MFTHVAFGIFHSYNIWKIKNPSHWKHIERKYFYIEKENEESP